jgi:hypothetical protein
MISITTESVLNSVHSAVEAYLDSDAQFDDFAQHKVVPGLTPSVAGAEESFLTLSKSGKQGVAILIHPPDIAKVTNNDGGVGLPLAEIRLSIVSLYDLNFSDAGPSKPIADIAWRLWDSLNNRQFDWIRGVRLICAGTNPIKAENHGEGDTENQSYEVALQFFCPAGYNPRVKRPVGTELSNGVWSFACATSGASIYYTTAETGVVPAYPTTTATLVSGNVTFESSCEVLVSAYKSGVVASEVAYYSVTVNENTGFTDESGNQFTTEGGQTIIPE